MLQVQPPPSPCPTLPQVLAHCYLGDWFVLYQLCKNSNSYFFRYLLRSLEKSLNAKVGLNTGSILSIMSF